MRYKYSCIEYLLFAPRRQLKISVLTRTMSNKTVLITGASYGIGASISYMLAKANATLILVARTEQKLRAMKAYIEKNGGKVVVFSVNLYNIDEVERLCEKLKEMDLKIDVFINNAGKSIKRSIFDSLSRFHDFTRTMSINFFAPVKFLLFLIPELSKNNGYIVNVSAMNVLLNPAPGWSAYQSSKAAFDNWFKSNATELSTHGISCSTAYLPLVKTRMIIPTKKYRNFPAMKPRHVADIVCRLIVSKKSKYAPWWTIFAQIGSVILRKGIEKYFTKSIVT